MTNLGAFSGTDLISSPPSSCDTLTVKSENKNKAQLLKLASSHPQNM